MTDLARTALPASSLYSQCDLSQFTFDTTADVEDLAYFLGQQRALDAIRIGVGIKQQGFNLYALGPPGVGKQTIISRFVATHAAQAAAPDDWVYVNNFALPHKPLALRLPQGRGGRLQRDMARLVQELRAAVPAAFESDAYRTQMQEIEQSFKEKQEHAFEEIKSKSESQGITLLRTAAGFAFAPVRDGSVMSPADFEKLPKNEQQRFEKDIAELQAELRRVIQKIPEWRGETQEKIDALNGEVAKAAVGFIVERIEKDYADLPNVMVYLNAVHRDVIANVDVFRGDGEESSPLAHAFGVRSSPLQRYEVNLVVDNGATQGAPVVYEDHPTYSNLVGRIEHVAMMGALITDFRLIKSGALHRANGGYLILDALKLLQQPYAWDGLKRALRSAEVRIESLEQMLSLVSTLSLEPECIPLNLKVVLFGDRMLYYMLYQLDPDFPELFKIAADFDDAVDRTPENTQMYARMLATLARQHQLQPLTRAAVGRVIEHGSRLVSDAAKLTSHMRSITDLLCEADYWRGEAKRACLDVLDVDRAIAAREERAGRMRALHLEHIARGTLLITTRGVRVGTLNGLSVIGIGDNEFGGPVRITAVVRMGEGEVIDIEREVELSGPIHSKGVFILSSYLGSMFSPERPLSLSASLVFEQSYGEIEGDSASSTELYALLSALAEAPIRQGLAVTGSVNQFGEIQAVGGVNEKIEGYFEVCRAQGLTADQGVLIPAANAKNLMLRAEVVAAVREGKFRVHAVSHVNEGIALLTGIEAGVRGADGVYPQNTINARVEARLIRMAELRHEFSSHDKDSDDGEDGGESD